MDNNSIDPEITFKVCLTKNREKKFAMKTERFDVLDEKQRRMIVREILEPRIPILIPGNNGCAWAMWLKMNKKLKIPLTN